MSCYVMRNCVMLCNVVLCHVALCCVVYTRVRTSTNTVKNRVGASSPLSKQELRFANCACMCLCVFACGFVFQIR